MDSRVAKAAVLVCLLFTASAAMGQTDPSNEKGLYFWGKLQGSSDDSGLINRLDGVLGYTFGRHFSLNAGVPVYFIHGHAESTTGANQSFNGLGNAYVSMLFFTEKSDTYFSSTLTATAPTGDEAAGLSTGRVTADWSNYLQHSFNRVSPFVSAGVANSIVDSHFFTRPFTSLGTVAHFEGGSDIEASRLVSVGMSVYADVPFGRQKVFSKLVKRTAAAKGKGLGLSRHGVFEESSVSSGDSSIDRDYGLSTWIDVTPKPYFGIEFGYSRSVKFEYHTLFYTISFNVGHLLRPAHHQQ